jgi:S1-C subfamily serine protease
MVGFAVVAEGLDFWHYRVDHVDAGSPAERAGLIEGDVLVEVDGRLAADLTMPEWHILGRGEPEAVLRLVGRRDRETLVIPIPLERQI